MPGLVPGIHVFGHKKDVDGRDKPGHDERGSLSVAAQQDSSVTSSENCFRTPATITRSGLSGIAIAPGMP